MGSKPKQISASRSSAILGLNPYRTEIEIWQEMIEEEYPGYNAEHNLKMPEQKDNPAMRWGLAFEDAICELAEKNFYQKNGKNIVQIDKIKKPRPNFIDENQPAEKIIIEGKRWEKIIGQIIDRERFFKKKKIITCHIDGKYSRTKILHEGKTTSYFYWKENFGEPGTDRIPIMYQSQAQHQLICTGADEVILSVLIFPRRAEEWEKIGWKPQQWEDMSWSIEKWENEVWQNEKRIDIMNWATTLDQMGYFQQYSVKKNIEVQQQMIAFYQWWWEKHIVEKKQPSVSNYDDIRRLWTSPCGTIVASEQLERWCKEYRDLGVELGSTGEMAKRREHLKVMILEEMRRTDSMVDDDSRDKTILRDRGGNKLLSFNGKVLR